MTAQERMTAVFADCVQDRYTETNGRAITVDGARWHAATDGSMALFISGAPPDALSHKGYIGEKLPKYLQEALSASSSPVEASDLIAFAGEATWAKRKPCEHCDGTQRLHCEGCGEPCDCECEECDEGFEYEAPTLRRVVVDGVQCDANRIAKLLIGTSGPVRVAAIDEPKKWRVAFLGEGWAAVLMGVLQDAEADVVGHWPAERAA